MLPARTSGIPLASRHAVPFDIGDSPMSGPGGQPFHELHHALGVRRLRRCTTATAAPSPRSPTSAARLRAAPAASRSSRRDPIARSRPRIISSSVTVWLFPRLIDLDTASARIHRAADAGDDVVDEGVVAAHRTVAEDRDRLPGGHPPRELVDRQVGPLPRAIDREEAQRDEADAVAGGCRRARAARR